MDDPSIIEGKDSKVRPYEERVGTGSRISEVLPDPRQAIAWEEITSDELVELLAARVFPPPDRITWMTCTKPEDHEPHIHLYESEPMFCDGHALPTVNPKPWRNRPEEVPLSVETIGEPALREAYLGDSPTRESNLPEGRKQRAGDQPQPHGVGENIQTQVMRDLEARLELGITRYGQGLKVFNNRDMIRDAYEEAMDLTVYLKGVRKEQLVREYSIMYRIMETYTYQFGKSAASHAGSVGFFYRFLDGRMMDTAHQFNVEFREDIRDYLLDDSVLWHDAGPVVAPPV